MGFDGKNLALMSGSCHFDRASNEEVSDKFLVIFYNGGRVLKFGAPSMYYKGAITQKR